MGMGLSESDSVGNPIYVSDKARDLGQSRVQIVALLPGSCELLDIDSTWRDNTSTGFCGTP